MKENAVMYVGISGFFFIGVIAYMDRSNIIYRRSDDERFRFNQNTIRTTCLILLARLRIYASAIRDVS